MPTTQPPTNSQLNGWKDTATQQPDADLLVLVATDSSREPVMLASYNDENGGWYDADSERLALRVTHWQELPEPPQ